MTQAAGKPRLRRWPRGAVGVPAIAGQPVFAPLFRRAVTLASAFGTPEACFAEVGFGT